MPNQERMYYMIDKDSGRIFDMRIPEVSNSYLSSKQKKYKK